MPCKAARKDPIAAMLMNRSNCNRVTSHMQNEENSSQQGRELPIAILAGRAREQGYLTISQIAGALPEGTDPAKLSQIVGQIRSQGPKVAQLARMEQMTIMG